MHIPRSFQQKDEAAMKVLIEEYPFATLITQGDNGLEANHLPFILAEASSQPESNTVLQGHIAKANPLWKNVADGSEVLLVFNGPHAYISPNYYPSKQEDGKAVPTWNYVVVHVKGRIAYQTDDEWNRDMISRLIEQHEADQLTPWSINDAPEAYIRKMLPAIVGIEIDILSMTGQWKLSQNHPEKNQQGVIKGLSEVTANLGDQQSDHIDSSVSAAQIMAQWVARQRG